MEEIGGFDEKIFMYGEEVEWCFRIKRNGFRIVYTPLAETYHLKGGSSVGQAAGILDEFGSLLYFYTKHKPGWQRTVLKFFLLSGAWLRIGIFGIIGRYKERGTYYAKAIEMVRR
jgi:GT2 family glycosyltransferase